MRAAEGGFIVVRDFEGSLHYKVVFAGEWGATVSKEEERVV